MQSVPSWFQSTVKNEVLIENKKNDLIMLLIQRAVGVHFALMSWGYISSDKCALCNRSETIEHCFLECPRIVKVWDHFSPLISTFLGSPFSVSPKSSTGVCLSQPYCYDFILVLVCSKSCNFPELEFRS